MSKYPSVELFDWLLANEPAVFDEIMSGNGADPRIAEASRARLNEITGLSLVVNDESFDDCCKQWLGALTEAA